jgi:hypothetical protein
MSAISLWLNRAIYLMALVAAGTFLYGHEWGAACWALVALIKTVEAINEKRRADRWEAFATNRAAA